MLSEIILNDVDNIADQFDSNFLRNKKVLITGASGLIGTYILAYIVSLINKGIPIEAYAQIFSDPPQHMLKLVSCKEVEVLQMDLSDINEYKRLPEVDIIVHSAGYAQPTLFMSDPIKTLQINTAATIALLKQLKSGGSFLFISSSEVYCGLTDLVFSEDNIGITTPYHPRASYIEGKKSGEVVCNAFRSQGVRAISVRLGDIYGPGTRKGDKRALNSFIEKALFNQSINLLDAGTAMRTYCYVSDVLQLLLKVLYYGNQVVYNVGGYSYVSIAELAKIIGGIIHVPVIFPSNEMQIVGSPKMLQLNLDRIETEFGKIKYIELEEGLRKTIKWQQELYCKEIVE